MGVYGPIMKRCRESFWGEVRAIRGLWNAPWCIGGDFNVIRFLRVCRKEERMSSSMRRFLEVIDELDLKDLPLQRGPFYSDWWVEWPIHVKTGSVFGIEGLGDSF